MKDTAPGTVSRGAGPPEITRRVKGGVQAAGDWGRGHRCRGGLRCADTGQEGVDSGREQVSELLDLYWGAEVGLVRSVLGGKARSRERC